MTKSANIESIEKATGRSWREWLKFLKDERETPHADIAGKIAKELQGAVDNPEWWAQGVTIAYEQHIGRREPGQRADGTFEVAVNRNMEGDRDEVFASVTDWTDSKTEFNGVPLANARISTTQMRSYWRCDLDDGSKVEAVVGPRSGGNYMVTISHTKLRSSNEADAWRAYWKRQISEI